MVPRGCCPRVGEVQPNSRRAVYRRAGRVFLAPFPWSEGEGCSSGAEGVSTGGAVPLCFEEGGYVGDVSACVEDFVYEEGRAAYDFRGWEDAADGA